MWNVLIKVSQSLDCVQRAADWSTARTILLFIAILGLSDAATFPSSMILLTLPAWIPGILFIFRGNLLVSASRQYDLSVYWHLQFHIISAAFSIWNFSTPSRISKILSQGSSANQCGRWCGFYSYLLINKGNSFLQLSNIYYCQVFFSWFNANQTRTERKWQNF